VINVTPWESLPLWVVCSTKWLGLYIAIVNIITDVTMYKPWASFLIFWSSDTFCKTKFDRYIYMGSTGLLYMVYILMCLIL
jgi:hypothetical protein